MEELNAKGVEILPYPLQRGLTRNLSMAAEAAGRSDLVPMWAGQSANLSACTDGPAAQWSANQRQKRSSFSASHRARA
jgi:nitronate monooxygenase